MTTRTHRTKPHDVLCTRPGPWGNHYIVGTHGGRGECCAMFRTDVLDVKNVKLRERIRKELTGKRLACACKPCDACHVDVYIEVCDGTTPWWATDYGVRAKNLFGC